MHQCNDESKDAKRRDNYEDQQLLINEIEIDEDQISPGADLKKDLGIDSLDFVDLFVIIETNFGFKMKAKRWPGSKRCRISTTISSIA